MAKEFVNVDTFQTRYFQSFVDLTQQDSTTYPAITTVRVDAHEMNTNVAPVSVYNIFNQYALRVVSV